MTKEVKIVKITDPVVQSLLFVFFAYTLDGGNYRMALLFLVGWQVLSAIVNSFLVFSKKKVIERTVNFVLTVLFLVAFFYLKKFKESYFEVILGDGPTMFPVHEIIVISTGVLICFWYYFISFREAKYLVKRKEKSERR